jgi:3-hydroxyacyl-CoA dehydrogenase
MAQNLDGAIGGDRCGVPELLGEMVSSGALGKKSGRGFYDYATTPPSPRPIGTGPRGQQSRIS